MKKIDWEIFFDNTSTRDALIDFAAGKTSFMGFMKDCWPSECKKSVRTLKRRGYLKAKKAARRALIFRGYREDLYWANQNE